MPPTVDAATAAPPGERGGERATDERTGFEPRPAGRADRGCEERHGERHLSGRVGDRGPDRVERWHEQCGETDVDGRGGGRRQQREPQLADTGQQRLAETRERDEREPRDQHEQHRAGAAVLVSVENAQQRRPGRRRGRGDREREQEQQPEGAAEASADALGGPLSVQRGERG